MKRKIKFNGEKGNTCLSMCSKHKMVDRVENVLEDRISGLPDEILDYVLSLMVMKEAGRTSVLSKRWRYIWTSIPSLNFDGSQILNELQLGSKLIKVERPVYLSWVNQVMKLHKGPTMEEFRVQFDLDGSCSYDIDNWVKLAMKKRVQRLELNLSDYLGAGQCKCYTFPDMQAGIINQLHRQPVRFSSCNSLTSLRLAFVNVTGEVLQYFLSNCPFLEHLSVDGSDSLINLKVAGPLLHLKCLKICYCFEMKSIEISAPNLLLFKYIGPKISIPFNNFPKLVEMSIGGKCCEYLLDNFLEHSSYLSQLETLTLRMNTIKLCLGKCDVIRKQRKAAACPHHYLKVVEFVGFVGNASDVELAMYLIENAVSLEKIILDPREPTFVGTAWEFEDTEEKQAARKCAEQLGAELPPGAALVIL